MVGYLTLLMILTGTYALFGLGLNLQWGLTGLINFGHVAFMTVGAYATVLLSSAGVSLWVAVPVGVALAALLGLLIGASTLRLREDYLAIVTIGASEVVRLVALNEEWLTRGPRGVYSYPLPLSELGSGPWFPPVAIAVWTGIFGLSLWQGVRWFRRSLAVRSRHGAAVAAVGADGQPVRRRRPVSVGRLALAVASAIAAVGFYGVGAMALWENSYRARLMLLVFVTLAVVYWQLERLARSPWGRVLKAIREDEEVAKALGKNAFWYKLQSLMLGGAIAGLAGAFFAWQQSFINPDVFVPLLTFQAWIVVVVGGAGNNAGTILGAVIYWAYTALTRFILPALMPMTDDREGAFRVMTIGLILIVLMMTRPQGILGSKDELSLGR